MAMVLAASNFVRPSGRRASASFVAFVPSLA
jgi:hypothetical protein